MGAVLLTPPEARCMLRSSSASCSQLVRMLPADVMPPAGSLAFAALADFFASSTAHCTSGGRSGAGAVQTAGSDWREHERFERELVSSQEASLNYLLRESVHTGGGGGGSGVEAV